MAPSTSRRIITALEALDQSQDEVQRAAAMAEDDMKEARQRFEAAAQRHEQVKEAASLDTDAIPTRMRELAQHLLVEDSEANSELEELLEPYVPAILEATSARLANGKTAKTRTVSQSHMAEEEIGDEELEANSPAVARKSIRATIGGDTPANFSLVGARRYAQLPWCTSIVLTEDNKWVELHCPDCGGNTSPSTGGLMRGVGAMHHHMVFSHDYESMPMDTVIGLAGTREVPLAEIEGMPYVDLVTTKTKTTEATKGRKINQPIGFTKGRSNDWSKMPWSFALNSANFLPGIPIIVKHPNGNWYVLECPVCHGNSSSDSRRGFFKGAKAINDHLRHAHKEVPEGTGPAAFIERCQVRELTDREVDKLRRDAEDAPAIALVQATRTATADALTEEERSARGEARVRRELTGTSKRKPNGKPANTEEYGRGMRPTGDASYDVEDMDDEEWSLGVPKKKKAKRSLTGKKDLSCVHGKDVDLDDDDEIVIAPRSNGRTKASEAFNGIARLQTPEAKSTPIGPFVESLSDDDIEVLSPYFTNKHTGNAGARVEKRREQRGDPNSLFVE